MKIAAKSLPTALTYAASLKMEIHPRDILIPAHSLKGVDLHGENVISVCEDDPPSKECLDFERSLLMCGAKVLRITDAPIRQWLARN
jgi:hypothetical protein